MNDITAVASALYEYLNTPVSLSCSILLRHKEWDELTSRSIRPSDYLDTLDGINRFTRDQQAVCFLKKCADLPVKVDRKAKAVQAFLESELLCFQTNERLRILALPPLVSDDRVMEAGRRLFSKARKIIARVLGPLPSGIDPMFGPGTSTELRGSTYTTVADKLG